MRMTSEGMPVGLISSARLSMNCDASDIEDQAYHPRRASRATWASQSESTRFSGYNARHDRAVRRPWPIPIFLKAQSRIQTAVTITIDSDDAKLLRKMVPLTTLSGPHFAALCAANSVEEHPIGSVLFRRGDTDTHFVYLLSGEISLEADALWIENIAAGSESARFPLAHQIPRKIDAVVRNPVRCVRIDPESINNPPFVYYEEEPSYMVTIEVESDSNGSSQDEDWMTALLKSPIFQRLPPSNLQKILMALQEISIKQGEVILRQGEPGDYYYLIKKGTCVLTRRPTPNAKEIKLAELKAHDSFGEDALISGQPRNVTITALTDMQLLRLDKDKFTTLIKQPVLQYIDYPGLLDEVKKGAQVLDVRAPDEYKDSHLRSSQNVPFFSLRMHIKNLNRKHKIILVCEDGKTSEAAAFLLMRNKYDALILKEGLRSVPRNELLSEAVFEIDDGIELDIHDNRHPHDAASPALTPLGETETESVHPPSEHSLAAQLEFLKNENVSLRRALQQLKTHNQKLTEEKTALEQKFRLLYKQSEKMKEMIKTLQGAGSS